MEAKTNIEKAKEQINQLSPIDKIANELNDINKRVQYLKKSQESGVYWFAKKGVALGEKELEIINDKLTKLNDELNSLRNTEEDLKEKERSTAIAIQNDEIGRKLSEYKKEVTQLEKARDNKKIRLERYNQLAKTIDLPPNPSKESFYNNRNSAIELKKIYESQNSRRN